MPKFGIELESHELVLQNVLTQFGIVLPDPVIRAIVTELEQRDHCIVHHDEIDGG